MELRLVIKGRLSQNLAKLRPCNIYMEVLYGCARPMKQTQPVPLQSDNGSSNKVAI